jgi:hypothetical protein
MMNVICVCVILHLKRHACVIISVQYNFLYDLPTHKHTTILMDALFILGHGVEHVSIDIHCLVSCNSEQWLCC